ncbi:TM2 domain-containing protein 1 [Rhincodon typus]|uniref:TM2 domain-containing protein 1 n=1 Tax=Rhincodon typus TaxID=259920 RepID=UPI00202DDD43|nr:TM2 domain-containing protein 1 [Rhincodon typus]
MALPRDRWQLRLCLLFLCFCFIGAVLVDVDKCEELRIGQYICDSPKINDVTQEPENCTNETAFVPCMPAPNITCRNYSGLVNTFTGKEVGFYKPLPCRNVSGYSYKVAVALSLFLGWLGADRFYLGYPALGKIRNSSAMERRWLNRILAMTYPMADNTETSLKLSPSFLDESNNFASDIIQHASSFQMSKIVGPADGSNYIIDYYGARLTRLAIDNDTYRKTQMEL